MLGVGWTCGEGVGLAGPDQSEVVRALPGGVAGADLGVLGVGWALGDEAGLVLLVQGETLGDSSTGWREEGAGADAPRPMAAERSLLGGALGAW